MNVKRFAVYIDRMAGSAMVVERRRFAGSYGRSSLDSIHDTLTEAETRCDEYHQMIDERLAARRQQDAMKEKWARGETVSRFAKF
jgi:hypothetical protein